MIYDSLITTSCWSLTPPPGWWTISPGLPTSPRTPSWRHGRFFLPMEMDRTSALKQRIWRFPEIGVPSVLINFDGIFHYKPSIGVYHQWKPPYEPRFHKYSINISVYITVYISVCISVYISVYSHDTSIFQGCSNLCMGKWWPQGGDIHVFLYLITHFTTLVPRVSGAIRINDAICFLW